VTAARVRIGQYAPHVWDPDSDARLRQLREAGTPYAECATQLGVSKQAATARAFRRGLCAKRDASKPKRISTEDVCRWRKLHPDRDRAHWTAQNQKRRELRIKLQEADLLPRAHRVSIPSDLHEQIVLLRQNGTSIRQTVRLMNVSEYVVRKASKGLLLRRRWIVPGSEAREKLYSSKRWRESRKRFLERFPLCAICEEEGRGTPATEVDHVDGHRRADWRERFWSTKTWQSLCTRCHGAKSAAEGLSRPPSLQHLRLQEDV
jgi:hypothetical protein